MRGQKPGQKSLRRIKGIPPLAVPDAWGYWFSGFVDGEGCFSICVRRDLGDSLTPRFSISQREDAEDVLHEIVRVLGVGGVSASGRRAKQYWVGSIAKCLALCDLFHRFPLRTKKRLDFEMWESILRKMDSTPCLTADDVREELETMARVKRMR